MDTQLLRNYAVICDCGDHPQWAKAMRWAAECIDRKYGTEECEGCHDRDIVIDRLRDLLQEGADGFGRVLVATSDDAAVSDWRKRVREALRAL